ncbi:lysophospholipase L1-like esterase [Anseongella ginsenosidimutans]|uniref:Lysophospholipase L1-like esterase n=1 Tax=Anseongella ginsenosidimutans TaxID=496056 RepID=A0A4R3KPB2_9SPHI|nr:SGNH/GDSL hydrolase family protein [Anseongella ginsenosidimutans]QEC53752.1 hypothetical protein FRZ59_16350 [Anseongella ginsenosidimutans]TCS85990.1 lysophospholipase L1-like esterase [Anseongella ginsenosidimutans]
MKKLLYTLFFIGAVLAFSRANGEVTLKRDRLESPAQGRPETRSQDSLKIKWWNPSQHSSPVIEGQAWPGEVAGFYDRLPARAQKTVREAVWDLSRESAGLLIRFRSDAPEIQVRYTVEDALDMPHMPSTGVSGLDLYSPNEDGQWEWTAGKYSFKDTITYHFQSLPHGNKREYHLYLPLYNKVKWLEIGVSGNAALEPLPPRKEKPIAIYGTSIAQGGCASRPGLAWTSILGRKLNRPVINLAFSGNGRLETALVDLLVELDPALFVIDCLPNMSGFPDDTIKTRLTNTISTLLKKRPGIPVLVTEHADADINSLNTLREGGFDRVNKLAREALTLLKTKGLQPVHLLSAEEIALGIESTVDGVHPNDIGMMEYAQAYEKAIRDILHEKDR